MLSEEPLFALNAADLTESEEKVWNIGRFLPSVRCGVNNMRQRPACVMFCLCFKSDGSQPRGHTPACVLAMRRKARACCGHIST